MPDERPRLTAAGEVLVLDSSTYIREIGLMSSRGSALKHYLFSKGMQLVIPEVVTEECQRRLAQLARGKRDRILEELKWLARFRRGIGGWNAPSNEEIEALAKALARRDDLNSIVLPETEDVRRRARLRDQSELPPSHYSGQLADCIIWEHCLDLLVDHDVIFVSADTDFCGHRKPTVLHPQLRVEAQAVGSGRRLTSYRGIGPLLHELQSDIPPIPNDKIFQFVYSADPETMQELRLNSECQPTSSGSIEQTLLTTDKPDVIEVRLQVNDTWKNLDGSIALPFELSGLCHYHLQDKRLSDLSLDVIRLKTTESDGTVRSVKGSLAIARATPIHIGGPPPIEPEQDTLRGSI